METNEPTISRLAVGSATFTLLGHHAREEAIKWGEGCFVKEVDVARIVGDEELLALQNSLHGIMEGLQHDRREVFSWHFLRPDMRPNKTIAAKDNSIGIEGGMVCILLPLWGEGRVRVIPNSTTETIRRSTIAKMAELECIVYGGSVAYTIMAPYTIFLHCVCSSVGVPSSRIYNPVNFACPHKATLAPTEIRAYPKDFVPITNPSLPTCVYSARTWKNVLDHLTVCKSNPAVDVVEKKKERRRTMNAQATACSICGQVCPTGNAVRQHKRRHHSVNGRMDSQPTVLSAFDAFVQMAKEPSQIIVPSKQLTVAPTLTLEELINTLDTSTDDEAVGSLLPMPAPQKETSLTMVEPLTAALAHQVVSEILASVTKAEVRQPSGSRDQNAGEISMQGVTDMIQHFGALKPEDVFLDVGSGVGNVVIQVALETHFASVIGIDMRKSLLDRSQALIDRHVHREQQLARVMLVHATIGRDEVENMPHIHRVTHVYCSNKLFSAEALLALEELYWLPRVRYVVLTQKPCPRHSKRCSKPFCGFWRLERTITVAMTYTHLPVELFFYTNLGEGERW